MATYESIYHSLIAEGIRRKYLVVPEFHVPIGCRSRPKKIDLAWLRSREEPKRYAGSLAHFELCAAFEIEGVNVSARRIHDHSQAISDLRRSIKDRFPCYIVLYETAFHRNDPNWSPADPDRCLARRQDAARNGGSEVSVLCGGDLKWVKNVHAA